MPSPMKEHREQTRELAASLRFGDIYDWIVDHGYYPESWVLPPCFRVVSRPCVRRQYYSVTSRGRKYNVQPQNCVDVHFPKSELTDRHFGVLHPHIHSDIAYNIARNWKTILKALIPPDSQVACYSFPLPVDTKNPGRVGHLRSARMIYEFLTMAEDDLVTVAYQYTHLVRADIRNFYGSIYTHSIAWAIHGKRSVRRPSRRHDYRLVGNRLDKLFQYANDQRTNGIPIGPVVSDIASEIVAAAVDRAFSAAIRSSQIDCEIVRFKDDYRILVRGEVVGKQVIKLLQAALREFGLELASDKTAVLSLPEGLFRPWVSMYHAVHPRRRRRRFEWKEFRELYLAVLRIDQIHPGTGVIDRFLADIVSRRGRLKVRLDSSTLQRTISMLLMLGARRTKAVPKIIGIIESVFESPVGRSNTNHIVAWLDQYLQELAKDEERNKYLISWIVYFFGSHGLMSRISPKPKFKDPITKSSLSGRSNFFRDAKDFKIMEGLRASGKRCSLLKHLDVFDPPEAL